MLKRLVSHSMNLAGGSSPASASAQHPGSWPSTRHRRGILQSSIQYSQNRRLETRQIVLNGCQTVSTSTLSYWCRSQLPMSRMFRHGCPGQSRSASSPKRTAASLMSSILRSTADTVFGSDRNASKSIPAVNCSMLMMASTISRRGRAGSLKGKDGLSRGFGRYRILQGLRWRQVDADTEHIGELVFDCDHVQKR